MANKVIKHSVISESAIIGAGARVHDFANIYGYCEIGENAVIGAFVEIQPGVKIGRNVKVSSHSFLCTGVTVEDDAFIGHGVTFINDRLPRSVFDDGTPVTAATTKVRPTTIGRRAAIGSNATIMCDVTVGEGAIVGAGSVVLSDVPPYAIVGGNPAKLLKSRSNKGAVEVNRETNDDEMGRYIQVHNQVLLDEHNTLGAVKLGPYSSYTWRRDPKHLLFTLSRYKFCSKLLTGRKSVLEIGCGDAIGFPILLQVVKMVHGVDLEPLVVRDNASRNEFGDRVSFEAADVSRHTPRGLHDAAISLDVIEHIHPSEEGQFLDNIAAALKQSAILIIGTPNITSQQYASEISKAGHINLKSHDSLTESLSRHFENVFSFSMNDEVVHTGFSPMAHYIFCVGVGKHR